MKRKTFVNLSLFLSVIYFCFMFGAIYTKANFGTWITISGIALMFAWMGQQERISN